MTAPDFYAAHASLVKHMSWGFWSRHLNRTTAVQRADVAQDAWLILLEHPEARQGLAPRRISWGLHSRYTWHGSRYRTEIAETELKETHHAWLWDFMEAQGSGLADSAREYLYQNLWAAGTEKAVRAVQRRLEGDSWRTRQQPQGVDPTTVRRTVACLLKAFPTKQELLGPSKAAWLHRDCVRTLAGHIAPTTDPDRRKFLERQLALGWAVTAKGAK